MTPAPANGFGTDEPEPSADEGRCERPSDEKYTSSDAASLTSTYSDHSSKRVPPIHLGRQVSVPTFPVATLPEWARNFVSALADSTQTPPDLSAMLVLAAMATAAARKVFVLVRPGWREPLNLYVAVAMPPGSRKSPVFNRVTAPLMAWERLALDWARPEIAEAEGRKRMAEDVVREAEKILADADQPDRERLTAEAIAAKKSADAITVPPPPRLLADDATPEAIASLLAEQGNRMAILSAEGDLFEIMAGRYSRSPNLGIYLKGWSGDDVRVDRKGRPPEHIREPAITLGLAVQPEVLITMGRQPGFRGRGLLGRFLYALPPSNVGRRRTNTPPVPDEVELTYSAEIQALATRMAELEQPEALTLSPAAAECFARFEAEFEPRLHPEAGDLGQVADWAAKLVGHTARVAGLLHVSRHLHDGWEHPIDADTVESAIAIAQYLIPHALAVFDLLAADPAVADARVVLDWLERTDAEAFTRRDCHRGLESRFPKANDLDPALRVLADRGWVRTVESPTSGPREVGRQVRHSW